MKQLPIGLHPIFTHTESAARHAGLVVSRDGYVHGVNRRAPGLSVLVVQPRADLLSTTVARYLLRASFAMAVLPGRALAAVNIVAFDGVVIAPELPGRANLVEALVAAGVSRILEHDDPIVVARELRTIALTRGARTAARRQQLHA